MYIIPLKFLYGTPGWEELFARRSRERQAEADDIAYRARDLAIEPAGGPLIAGSPEHRALRDAIGSDIEHLPSAPWEHPKDCNCAKCEPF